MNGGFSRNVSSQSFELGGNSNRNEDVRRHDNENNLDYNDYENLQTATDNNGSNINSNDNPNRNQNDLNSEYNDSHSIRDHGYYEERDLTTRIGSSNSHSPNNQQTTRTRRESRQSDNNASDRDIAVGSNPTSLYSGSSSSRELLFSSDSERDCECGYQYNYRYQTQYRYGSTKRKSFTSKSLVNVAQKLINILFIHLVIIMVRLQNMTRKLNHEQVHLIICQVPIFGPSFKIYYPIQSHHRQNPKIMEYLMMSLNQNKIQFSRN